MVKARSFLYWPITDSEWINGSQSRSGGHEGQCTTTLGRQAEPKGGIERATDRAMPWALATTPPTNYSKAPVGLNISTS